MKYVTYVLFACLPVCTNAVSAQTMQPSGYHTVACVKVENGKGAEYRDFVSDTTTKYMQALADAGEIAGWYMLRSAMPSGSDARCDYVSVSLYNGLPSNSHGMEHMNALMQKAGIGMTAEQYIARRSELSRLVSNELWRNAINVGTIQKGDFAFINFMKVHNMKDYMELESTIWKPMAATWVEKGEMHGWSVNRPVLPGGTDIKYHAVTLDIFPSFESAMAQRSVSDTFKAVHAGKNEEQTFERLDKSRDLALRVMMVVTEKVSPARVETSVTSDRSAGRQ